MYKYRFFETDIDSNGTRDIIITDEDGTVLDSLNEAVFGNLESKKFGWSGDAMGNIDVCYYGDSVNMMSYDDESVEAIQSGDYLDLCQVVEVTLKSILQNIAVSPVNDGSSIVEFFKQYSNKSEA